MTDCRFSRLLTKLEIPLLLAVPAVMATALLAGVEQAALAMLVVVALVLALFFAGYEASRPGLRQIMPTLVLAALAASGTSVITHPEHIDRGYAAFTEILASLGAQIRREAPLRNTSTKKTSSKKQNHLAIGPKRWYDTVI